MTTPEALLLVMGSGDVRYREYLMASAARRQRLWLFDPDPATWQRQYLAGSTVLDVFDPSAAVAEAMDLARAHPIRGVYCYHEAVILAAAHVASALGVPGPSVAAVSAVRDKSRTREMLTRAGLPQPRYAVVTSTGQAEAAARDLGFPLVSKPCGLGASQGVVRVNTLAELAGALAVSRSATQRGMATGSQVLLEEFLTGPEVSIDAAIVDGDYLPFFVARKELGHEPFFEEIGHIVASDDPLLSDKEFMRMLADAHRAVGWRNGMTHAEVKLTSHGPVTVEINGRLGGDLIPYVGQLATGIDAGQVAVDVAQGQLPQLEPRRQGAAGIRFLYPPADCRVREVTLPRPADIPGLHQATVMVEPGSELRLPPGAYTSRYGYLIGLGTDARSCTAALSAAAARSSCAGDPLRAGP